MKKITFYPLFFLLICNFIQSCEKTEPFAEEPDSISLQALNWYQEEHNPKLENNPSFYGVPDWENVVENENGIVLPLLSNIGDVITHDKSSKHTFATTFLIIEKDENDSFSERLDVKIYKDLNTYKGSANDSDFYLRYNDENILEEVHLPADMILREPIETENTSKSGDDGCVTIGIFLTTTYTDGTSEKILLRTFEECPVVIEDDENGSGGAGSGDGGEDDIILVPSCKSFEFANGLNEYGQTVKGGATVNITGYFFATGIETDGSPYFADKLLLIRVLCITSRRNLLSLETIKGSLLSKFEQERR